MKTILKTLILSSVAAIFFEFVSEDVLPVGWEKSGTNVDRYKIGVDNKIFQHGQKSAFIESIDQSTEGLCVFKQKCSDINYKGKRVKMTGFIKSEGINNSSQMWVRVDDIYNNVVADIVNMDNNPVIGSKDWTKYELIFDVPDTKSIIYYGIFMQNAGKTWIDNISFEIVDSSTKREAYRDFVGTSLKNTPPKEIPEQPFNLDFEQ